MLKCRRRMILLIAIIVAAALSLSGCTGSNSDKVLQSKASGGQKTKIKFWTHYTIMKDLQTKLINDFNAKNNDVEIEINMVGDKYSDVLNMAMASGESPDVFSVTGPSLTKKAANLKWAEPLNKYITDDIKAKFDPRVWVEGNNVIKGNIYVIPDQLATFRMLYNKDLFKKAGLNADSPPKTFAQMREYSKRIKDAGDEGTYGYALSLGDDGYYLDLTIVNGLGYYALGTVQGFDYRTGKFDYTVYIPALQLIRDMRADKSMMEGALLLKADQVRSKFAEGKIGMIGAASWETSIYNDLKLNFDAGLGMFPTVDGAPRGKSNIQIGSGYAMSAKCANKDAAWKALSYICSPQYIGTIIKQSGSISAFKEDSQINDGKFANPYVKGFLPGPDDAIWPPLVPSLKLQGDNRLSVFTKIISDPNVNMEAELKDLSDRMNDAFNKSIANNEFSKDSYYKPDFNPLTLK